jgi:DnaJ-class molecular chaperone
MLKLSSESELVTCPRCEGRGWLRCPKTFSIRTNVHYSGGEGYGSVMEPSAGKKIPCDLCKGKKVVSNA